MKRMIYAAVFCALIALSAWTALPLAGIPLTLQTLAVALCGYCLGWKGALAAVAAYLTLGGFGLPVFSGFSGGVGWLIGPSGGYFFGFFLLAVACGLPIAKNGWRGLAGMLGLAALHLCGAGWYALCTHQTLWQSLLVGSLPYLVKDLACLGLALWVSNKIGFFKKRP